MLNNKYQLQFPNGNVAFSSFAEMLLTAQLCGGNVHQISNKTYAFVDEEDESDDYHDFTFMTDGYFTLKELLQETFDCLETQNDKLKLIDAAIEDLEELREEIEKNKVG
ncbi:MAG: hypothetical protein J6Y55_06325 [Bacteroidales bacterium]|nr:hypothetical protein [Bacteroidales bacterium]